MKRYAGPALMKRWIWIVSLLCIGTLKAQSIAIGSWRTHFSYQSARLLTATESKVFCAVENGLFSYSVDDRSIRKLSKLDGLSGAGVTAMAYHPDQTVLVIGYSSGQVDLIFEDEIININDIANSSLQGSKAINAVSFGSDQVFLGTDLGVIVIDLARRQIVENYIQIGSGGAQAQVVEVLVTMNTLWIKTQEGVQAGDLDQNLLDVNNWTRFPSTGGYEELTLVGSLIHAKSMNELVIFNGVAWENAAFPLPEGTTKLYDLNGQLYTSAGNMLFRLDESGFNVELSAAGTLIKDVVLLDNQIYLADHEIGLMDENGDVISPSGPVTDVYSGIKVIDDQVYGFHAPNVFTYDGSQQVSAFSLFSDSI